MAILHPQPILTLDLPELALYRTLRRPEEHERLGMLVATNAKVVQRLLASRFTVESLLLTPDWLERLSPALLARPEAVIRIYLAEKPLMETLLGYSLHQGALAAARIPPQPTLAERLAAAPRPLLLAAIDGVNNAENMGMIVRNAAAFGVSCLIVGETSISPFQRRAVSGSMGTIFEQPVVRTSSLSETLADLRQRGVRCLAAHPRPGSRPVAEADLRGDCCFVFGAEGPGLGDAVVAACEEAVQIPLPAHVDSLNVATAVAICLYEATRQRALSPSCKAGLSG